MKKFVVIASLLLSSTALAEDGGAPSKMSEVDYLKLQVMDLQSKLEEATQRAFACEHATAETERNKKRQELAGTYKIGPTDQIKTDGSIVRAASVPKKPAKK